MHQFAKADAGHSAAATRTDWGIKSNLVPVSDTKRILFSLNAALCNNNLVSTVTWCYMIQTVSLLYAESTRTISHKSNIIEEEEAAAAASGRVGADDEGKTTSTFSHTLENQSRRVA